MEIRDLELEAAKADGFHTGYISALNWVASCIKNNELKKEVKENVSATQNS